MALDEAGIRTAVLNIVKSLSFTNPPMLFLNYEATDVGEYLESTTNTIAAWTVALGSPNGDRSARIIHTAQTVYRVDWTHTLTLWLENTVYPQSMAMVRSVQVIDALLPQRSLSGVALDRWKDPGMDGPYRTQEGRHGLWIVSIELNYAQIAQVSQNI